MELHNRCDTARRIAIEAGGLALDYFNHQDALKIDAKGHQDFVSQADREVELLVRRELAAALPDDAIVGEEHAPTPGTSGFTWVIDPIDGTANFVTAIPAWVVVIAGVSQGRTQIGIIHDPNHGETFVAIRGGGATLNGAPLKMRARTGLGDGTTGVGFSRRTGEAGLMRLMQALIDEGGLFMRNASGALSLAYVAAGRLLGYAEEHMNAWDYLAGQLIIEEAGGGVELQDADAVIRTGGRVIVGAPGVFDDLLRISDAAFKG